MDKSGIITGMNQLVMYTRERTCADQEQVRLLLKKFGVSAVEINITREPDAAEELLELIGCLAVPTLVVVDEDDVPLGLPAPMNPNQSVRNVDRGAVISEPSRDGLRRFLSKHGW